MQPETSYERLQRKPLKPLTYRTLIYVAAGMTLLLVIPAIFLLTLIFDPGTPLNARLLISALAATMLAFPARVAFVTLRRKLKTGQVLPSDTERLENRYKWAMQENSPRRRKVYTAIWSCMAIFWIAFGAYMLRAALHHPSKRGWTAFILLLAVLNLYTPIRLLRDRYRPSASIH